MIVPGISLGFNTTLDPANSMFTGDAGNFRDASAGQLTDARQLYAILTGRVTAVTGQAALDPDTGTSTSLLGPRRRAGKMNEYSLFVQDSWRATPTLTINAGLRWDVQMPFSPVNDVMSTVTLADICGMSGLGSGGTYSKCNFYAPGATRRQVPRVLAVQEGEPRLQHRLEQHRAESSAWRGGRTCRAAGSARCSAIPTRRRCAPATRSPTSARAWAVFTGQFGANPGSTLSLTRNNSTGLGQGPARHGRCSCAERTPVQRSRSRRRRRSRFRPEPNRADSIDGFAPDIVIASARIVDGRVPARAVAQHGDGNPLRRHARCQPVVRIELQRAEPDRERILRRVQARDGQPAGEQRLGRRNRAGSFAYFGPGTGHQSAADLPRLLEWAARNANNPAAYTGGTNTWTNSTLAQRFVKVNPKPGTSATDLDGTLARRQNAARGRFAAPNFFVVNPDVDSVNVYDSGAFSDYHALQLELRRRLSRGLQINSSYQYAIEGGSAFLGFRYGRVMNPDQRTYAMRSRRSGTGRFPSAMGSGSARNMNPILNGVLGGWTFNGVGRIQARMVDFGNVSLVGMTPKDVQKLYKHDIRIDPATGLRTVFTHAGRRDPQHPARVQRQHDDGGRLLHLARACPKGRYFAPANSADCIQLKTGDCAPRTLMIRAPLLHPLRHRRDEEVPDPRLDELRAARGRAERVRQHQLQPVEQPRHWRRDFPGHQRVFGSQQRVRSGRPARSARVPVELVGESESSQLPASRFQLLVPLPAGSWELEAGSWASRPRVHPEVPAQLRQRIAPAPVRGNRHRIDHRFAGKRLAHQRNDAQIDGAA